MSNPVEDEEFFEYPLPPIFLRTLYAEPCTRQSIIWRLNRLVDGDALGEWPGLALTLADDEDDNHFLMRNRDSIFEKRLAHIIKHNDWSSPKASPLVDLKWQAIADVASARGLEQTFYCGVTKWVKHALLDPPSGDWTEEDEKTHGLFSETWIAACLAAARVFALGLNAFVTVDQLEEGLTGVLRDSIGHSNKLTDSMRIASCVQLLAAGKTLKRILTGSGCLYSQHMSLSFELLKKGRGPGWTGQYWWDYQLGRLEIELETAHSPRAKALIEFTLDYLITGGIDMSSSKVATMVWPSNPSPALRFKSKMVTKLGHDIQRLIFELAAWNNNETAARLMCVCQIAHKWVKPILYRDLILDGFEAQRLVFGANVPFKDTTYKPFQVAWDNFEDEGGQARAIEALTAFDALDTAEVKELPFILDSATLQLVKSLAITQTLGATALVPRSVQAIARLCQLDTLVWDCSPSSHIGSSLPGRISAIWAVPRALSWGFHGEITLTHLSLTHIPLDLQPPEFSLAPLRRHDLWGSLLALVQLTHLALSNGSVIHILKFLEATVRPPLHLLAMVASDEMESAIQHQDYREVAERWPSVFAFRLTGGESRVDQAILHSKGLWRIWDPIEPPVAVSVTM